MEKLTKKQRGFVKDYIDTGNGVQSALNHYDTDNYNSANQIAIENLQKPTILQAIESHAEKAESMVYHLSQNAKAEVIRLNASKDILDRAGYKPIDRSVNTNLNLTKSIDPTDETIINSLKAIQEKLEND